MPRRSSSSTTLSEDIIVEEIHKLDLVYRVVCIPVAQIHDLRTGELVFESTDEVKAKKAFKFMRGEP